MEKYFRLRLFIVLLFTFQLLCLSAQPHNGELDSLQQLISVDRQQDSLANWLLNQKKYSQYYRKRGNTDSSLLVLNKALNSVWRKAVTTEEKKQLAWFYVNRAYLYEQQLGRFIKAKEDYLKAYELFDEIKLQSFNVASYVWRPLANIYTRLGENELAIELLQAFFSKAEEIGNTYMQLSAANDLGRAYMNKQEYERAITLMKEVLRINYENNFNRGLLYSSLSECYINVEEYSDGKINATKSIELLSEVEKGNRKSYYFNKTCREYLLGSYTQLGIAHSKMQEFEKATLAFEKANTFKDAFTVIKHRKKAKLYLAKANNALAAKKGLEALQFYHETLIESVRKFNNKDVFGFPDETQLQAEITIGFALIGKAKATLLLYETSREKQWLESGINAFKLYFKWEKLIRSEYRFEPSKLLLAKEIHANTESALNLLAELQLINYDEKWAQLAFSWMEQSKGVLLSESETSLFSAIPQLQNDTIFLHLQSARKHYRLLVNESDSSTLFEKEKRELKKEIIHLENVLLQAYPYYHHLKAEENKVISIDSVTQYLLSQNADLLSYYVGKSSIYLTVISQGQFYFHSLGEVKKLRQLAHLGELLRNHERTLVVDFANIAHKIYNWLIQPTMHQAAKDNWIIIPDGILHDLPFETLVTKVDSADESFKQLDYLLHQKSTMYAPSIKFLLKKRRQVSYKRNFLGIAPDFKKSFLLSNLEEATTEVGVGQKHFRGSILKGSSLSKTDLINKLPESSILHWVSHAGGQKKQLHDAWIAVSSVEDTIVKLYPPELLPLQLSTELLVLNACETASGSYKAGEGNYSLTRSFLYAGVQNVITNLWKANHAANAKILKDFYQLVEEKGNVKALQAAKLNYLQNESTDELGAHPYYWSSLVLIGNNKNIHVSNFTLSIRWYILILAVGIILGYMYFKK